MTDAPDWKTIDRYLAGEASPAERAAVDDWIAAQPNRDHALAWLKRQPTPGEPTWNVDAAWQRFDRSKTVVPISRPWFKRPAAWAAALIVAVGLGSLATLRTRGVGGTPQMHEVFTLNGQRTTLTLDDGTRIALNGASRLRYDASYGKRTRDVHLDGEAYFEVTHDARRPFRVHARHAVAEDLGTRFIVRAYADQPTVEVAVTEGIVALGRDSSTVAGAVRITAGELGVLPVSGEARVTKMVVPDRYVGWTGGSLVLDSVPLRQAAKVIERWFGVPVTIADSALASRPVAARFQRESVRQVMEAIAFALGARLDTSGTGYVLSGSRK